MKPQYAEVKVHRESDGWYLVDCSEEFLLSTGFSRADISDHFGQNFLKMFSAADLSTADKFFSENDTHESLCPWIFTLSCFKKNRTLPVLFQLIPLSDEPDTRLLRIHPASFLNEQSEKIRRRLLSLENSIPSGLCQVLYDEHFTVVWHNTPFLEALGYTEEQFVQELKCRGTNYLHPDDAPVLFRLLQNAIDRGLREITTELRIIRRDGEVRTLLASLNFTEEEINGIPLLYSAGIDITEQKRSQRLDTEHMRFAAEQISSTMLEYEVASRRLLESESLRKYFGYEGNVDNAPEPLIASGKIAEDSIEVLRSLFAQINAGSERAEGIVCLIGQPVPDEQTWIHLRFTSLFNDAGKPVKAILLAEDITEHHKIELRYREEEIRMAAMSYDWAFSCQVNLTTERIISANESHYPFFNFTSSDSAKELLHTAASQIVSTEDRAEYLKKFNIEYMMKQFESGISEITLDFRVRQNDDTYLWYRTISHIIQEPSRRDLYAYIYSKNIHEYKIKDLELHRHAEQDALTGLLNRYTMELRCDQALKNLRPGGLCVMYMLDLDNFKYLNDTYGHLQGDEMLRRTALSLKKIFSKTALLGRIGGDEFAAFEFDCPSAESAFQTVEQVCKVLSSLDVSAGVVTVSAGIAFSPKDGCSFAELYCCSDEALYRAKHAGKNCWAAYEKTNREDDSSQNRLPVSREWLLEESSDIIYVSDFYSYDLLYMNQGARKVFGIEDQSYRGRKCYEVLQQKIRPCEFCTNHLLCREKFYCWEFRNKSVGKSLLLRDRIVDWYGIPARIEFATDVSIMDKRTQDLEDQIKIDDTIISCLHILSRTKPLLETAFPMLEKLAAFYDADHAFILEYTSKKNLLLPLYEWNKPNILSMSRLIPGKGVSPTQKMHQCILDHENYLFDRTEDSPEDIPQYLHLLYDGGICCQRAVPFYLGDEPAGLIGINNPTFYREEMTVLETLSYFLSEEISRSRLSESLKYLSYHDSLTGLLNRNQYVNYLSEMDLRNIRTLGIAVADLNALKEINKYRGHSQGDVIVKGTASLLTECFPGAKIFRLSGDEFVVHSENLDRLTFLKQVSNARENAQNLNAYGISIGSVWTDREFDSSKLTTQATDIMLIQKQEFYQEHKKNLGTGKHNNTLFQSLLLNIEKGYFKMFLQPKADCHDFRLNGAEALVRYESPETGLIPPDKFIPLLEKEHIIQYIDLFMFEEVCRLLARWIKEGRKLFTISLNFSRQTVLEPNLSATMHSISERYQVPKEYIEVEITESLGEYERSTIAEIGEEIKAAGFRLALDDFGSHYTNMAMLSTVPADVLKLDRGLIKDVMSSTSNKLVLKSILLLCRDLGVSSIAEGVETESQLELLRSLGCDSIQGYLFGRPSAVQDFETLYL